MLALYLLELTFFLPFVGASAVTVAVAVLLWLLLLQPATRGLTDSDVFNIQNLQENKKFFRNSEKNKPNNNVNNGELHFSSI